MRLIAGLVRVISAINWVIGQVFSWLALAVVVVCFTVVVQRYFFSTSVLWMRDLYVWLGGAMFTAVAGFALLRDDHVRVDIFYRPAPPRTRALLDLIGVVLFLLPFCAVVWFYSWGFVARSFGLREASSNPGGMPGLYILKAFILAFVVLVGLQGLAMLGRSILTLAGREKLLPLDMRYKAAEEPQG